MDFKEKKVKNPEMTDQYISTISERYIELYEQITGEKFVKVDLSEIKKIESILMWLVI